MQQRPGGAPVSTDEDEDEDDWRPQAHDEIEDDDPHCVGSPTLEGPPAKRLRRRVTAAPTTAASAASAASGASGASLRNFFTVAHAPAVASQRRSSTNTTEAARVSTSNPANAQQAHFVRQPAAATMGAAPPVGLGTTRWALTDNSESDNEEVAARASVANVAASRHGATVVDDSYLGDAGSLGEDGNDASQGHATATFSSEKEAPGSKGVRNGYMKRRHTAAEDVLGCSLNGPDGTCAQDKFTVTYSDNTTLVLKESELVQHLHKAKEQLLKGDTAGASPPS